MPTIIDNIKFLATRRISKHQPADLLEVIMHGWKMTLTVVQLSEKTLIQYKAEELSAKKR